jgi:glucose-6-phosphate isomerase
MRARVAAERDVRKNPALFLAAALHQHHLRRGRPIVAMMAYADGLADLVEWWRQLWGEGLHHPTPIGARGAPDQHAQLELFLAGPDDKIVIFVTVGERGTDLTIPASEGELAYLGGHALGEILDEELRITRLALGRARRPHATITLERLDAAGVGELVMLLQAAAAFAGPLYGADPFVQQAVERGKDLAYARLGRPGYESLADEAAARPPRDPLYVL